MGIGVDTSKWKPRKLQGTPALKFSRVVGYGILGLGVAIGVFLQCSDFTKRVRTGFEKLYEDPIEEVERRLLIGRGLPTMTGDELRKIHEETLRIDRPDA